MLILYLEDFRLFVKFSTSNIIFQVSNFNFLNLINLIQSNQLHYHHKPALPSDHTIIIRALNILRQ